MFTKEEKDYIKSLILSSKESLDDICDEHGIVQVDWMQQADVNEEYKLINIILDKLG